MQLPLVLLWGTICPVQTARLSRKDWAEQSWGTTSALKIALTLDKFRRPAQATNVLSLYISSRLKKRSSQGTLEIDHHLTHFKVKIAQNVQKKFKVVWLYSSI